MTTNKKLTLLTSIFLSFNIQISYADDTWHTMNPPSLDGAEINSLVVNPTNPAELFLGTYLGGAYKSTDSGVHWSKLNENKFSYADVNTIATDPNHPNIVYLSSLRQDAYRSTNGGNTWQALTSPESGNSVNGAYAFRFSPINPNEVWMFAADHTIYHSVDSGETWEKSGIIGRYMLKDVAINPANPNRMLVIGSTIITPGSTCWLCLYGSDNGGSSWSKIYTTDSPYFSDYMMLQYSKTKKNTVYLLEEESSLLVSKNDGITWDELHNQPGSFVIDPANPHQMYSTTHAVNGKQNILVSKNDGIDWELHAEQVPISYDNPISISPSHPNVFYALSNDNGVARSEDNGKHWTVSHDGLKNILIEAIYATPKSNLLYIRTNSKTLWRTENGELWEKTKLAIDPLHLIVNTADPRHLVLFNTIYTNNSGGIMYSHDKGETWKNANVQSDDNWVLCFAANPSNPNHLIAGGFKQYLTSTDGGENWKVLAKTNTTSNVIAFNPTNPTEIYSIWFSNKKSNYSDLYKSVNGGLTWQVVTTILPVEINQLVIDSINPSILYAASEDGVYKSIDRGETWRPINNGLPVANQHKLNITSLLMHPNNPQILFTSIYDQGVYVTKDGGAHWSSYTSGLETPYVKNLAWYHDKLIAGTYGLGLYANENALNPTPDTKPRVFPVGNSPLEKSMHSKKDEVKWMRNKNSIAH